MSRFQEQPLPISVPTVADLATARARTANGGVVATTGRTTAGDGGAGQYIYRRTGRSGVTLNGFHIAGPGVDDYWENVNKLEANAIQWGCDRTGNSDCSAALVAATAALPTGGAIVFPAGTYLITQTCTLAPAVFMPGARIKTSGTPAVTIDSYTATPTQWVFDTVDGGSVTITKKHPVTVENWGAVGDGVTDDSARGQAAINATNNVELLAKTYRATWVVNPNAQAVSIKGRKTRLIAANNNEFALTISGNFPGGVARVSEIEFYHQQGVMQRHGMQISSGSAVFVDNCWFSYCGLGLVLNSSIELRFTSCWFRENYIGLLITTRSAASGNTVSDIAGQTVTLAEPVLVQHPTENSFVGMVFNTNKIGVVCEQPGNVWAYAQDLLFDKAVFQYGNIGILLIAPNAGDHTDTTVVVNSSWCEANTRSNLTVFDGVEYQGGDYVTNFGVLEINNGIVETVRASDTADVRIYGCSLNETTRLFTDSTASIVTELCYGDNITIDMPSVANFALASGRAALSKSLTTIGTSYALGENSKLIRAYTCHAGDHLPLYAGEDLGTFPGGVLPSNECAAYRCNYLQGPMIPFTSVEDTKYSLKFSIRSHCPARTFTANASTDVFTSVAHGLANGMEMNVTTSGTLPAGMAVDTSYFVINKTDDTFQLAAANDVRIQSDNAGTDYSDKHTYIGSAISGDFVLEWKNARADTLEPSMVVGVSVESSANPSTNYNVLDYGIQYINATTMKLWKNGVESTHTVNWTDGFITITRTGSTITVEIDGVISATATDNSFTTATVYPFYTAASESTAVAMLYGRPTATYTGSLLTRTFLSDGEPIDITDTGSGIHSIAQVASFQLQTAPVGEGAIAGVRYFTVTDQWQTWSIHGGAAAGGTGTTIFSAVNSGEVRDIQLSAVNLVEHASNAGIRDFEQSRCFYAFAGQVPLNPKEKSTEITSASTPTIDFTDADGDTKTLTLTGLTSPTITMDRPGYYALVTTQDATGYREILWPTNMKWTYLPPQPNQAPGSKSLLEWVYDGTHGVGSGVDHSDNYVADFDAVGAQGYTPAINWASQGTILIKLRLAAATPASKTRVINAGDSHYPFTDGLAYLDILRSTRVESIALSGSVTRTQWHWLIIRTDSTDGWEALQATLDGTLYSISTAAHESVGSVSFLLGTTSCQAEIDRMWFFDSRLIDSDLQICMAYAKGEANTLTGLLARWEMQYDRGGKLIQDSSGNGRHIELTNATPSLFVVNAGTN